MQVQAIGMPARVVKNAPESPELKDACEKFSALFINMLWKEMRNTVPEDGLMPKSSAEKIFQEMMDYEISEKMAKSDNFPLAKVLYDQLRMGLKPEDIDGSEK